MLDATRLDGAKRLIEKRVTQVAVVVWLSGLVSSLPLCRTSRIKKFYTSVLTVST